MGFWSWITGGSSVAEKVTDGVVNGVDAIFYTDEEKAQDGMSRTKLWLKVQEVINQQQGATAITRRVLAVIAAIAWCFSLIMVAASIYGYGSADNAIALFNETSKAFMLVMAFYFGKHVIMGLTGKKN